MIRVRGRNVTLTGKDAAAVQKVADALGISADEAFANIMRDMIKSEKKRNRKAKK